MTYMGTTLICPPPPPKEKKRERTFCAAHGEDPQKTPCGPREGLLGRLSARWPRGLAGRGGDRASLGPRSKGKSLAHPWTHAKRKNRFFFVTNHFLLKDLCFANNLLKDLCFANNLFGHIVRSGNLVTLVSCI